MKRNYQRIHRITINSNAVEEEHIKVDKDASIDYGGSRRYGGEILRVVLLECM